MQQALEIIVGGVLQGGAFALVALGFALIYRVTGMLNLAQGAFVVIGALLLYTFHQALAWPLAPAFLLALVICTLIGAVLAQFAFEPALRKLPPGGAIMVTVGAATFFQGAMLLIWGSAPYQPDPFSGSRPYDVGGILFPTQAPWDAGATVLIVAAMWYVLQKTRLGMALRACAENHAAAALMGIDVRRMTIYSYAVAAGLGAIAGMLIGPIISIDFSSGGIFSTSGFIAVTIGGAASFFGPIVGGLALGVIEQGAAGYISSLFANPIALVLLLVMLAVRPTGILSARIQRRQDVREVPRIQSDVSTRLGTVQARTLAALALLLVVVAPLFLGAQLLSSIVISGITFIALLGLDVVMGYCGLISLGSAAFMAIGGYVAAIACVSFNLAPLVGTLAGIIVSLACAAVLAFVTVNLRGLYLALATLSFGLLVDALALGLRDWTGGPSGLPNLPSFALGGYTFTSPIANYYLVWAIVVVSLIVLANALRSNFGRTLRAIRTDQTAALALGIDVPRYKLYAFLISAAFASLAGSLLAFDFHFISPGMVSTDQSFLLVTMLVIGGEGTLVGPVIGVILLTLLPTIFQFLDNYKTLVSGLLLIVALLYFPSGLYGGFTALIRRFTGTHPSILKAATASEDSG